MSTSNPVVGPVSGSRAALLRRIAELWRGDWTGNTFDGRDGSRWIRTAIEGDEAALTKLAEELAEVERAYE